MRDMGKCARSHQWCSFAALTAWRFLFVTVMYNTMLEHTRLHAMAFRPGWLHVLVCKGPA
jgi:hypothetical protein